MNTQRCALRFLSLRYEEAACQNPSDCCWPRILSTDLNIRAAQTMDVWVTPRSSAASRIARLAFLSACLFSSRRINEQALRKKIYTYIYICQTEVMENAISFYTDWDIYKSLTKENQIIESFESLSQSHRVCGNPCMRRSSALHCQVSDSLRWENEWGGGLSNSQRGNAEFVWKICLFRQSRAVAFRKRRWTSY